jgi:outer membrane biosynthesis protein TonB
MTPLRRWLDAFVALPERLKLPFSILLAIVAHGVLFFLVWLLPLLANLLRFPALFPQSCRGAAAATPTPAPSVQPLELVSIELSEKTQPPSTPPKPDNNAPLTQQEQEQLQQLFAELPQEDQRKYIDVEGLAKRKNLSKRALLESWRDSVAGSSKPGRGPEPLPSQEGRTDIPFAGFKNQQANPVDPKTFDEESGAPGQPKPLPTVKFPGLEAPPIYRPRPVAKNELAANPRNTPKTAEAASPPPPPPPEPSTPRTGTPAQNVVHATEADRDRPMRLVKLDEKDVPLFVLRTSSPASPAIPELKLPEVQLKPEPKAEPTPKPKPTPAPTPPPPKQPPTPEPVVTPPPAQVAKLANDLTKPTPVKNPNYTSHSEMKKIDGSGPAGESGVDAVATERGKYKKMMKMMVESRWLPAVRARGDLIREGTVAIHFAIDGKGKLTKFKVEYNTSNNAHAMVVEEAMRATRFEAPPPEMLRNGIFEDEFTFTLY